MSRKIFLSALFILYTCLTSLSQGKKFLYYLDDKFEATHKSKATFTGTGTKEDGLIMLQIVDNKTNQTIIVEHYTDSSLSVSQGLSQSFFNNGIKESEGNYDNNKKNGVWVKWDNTGRVVDSSLYDHDKKISSTTFSYYKQGKNYRYDDFKTDKMHEIHYNDSGKVRSEVLFTGNSGVVKRYNKEGVKIDTVFSREEVEASFPGGDAAWSRYIRDVIMQNIDAITRDKQSGTCRVRFIVDKDGNVKNPEALTMKGSVLAEVAVKALKNGPKWRPAIQYGKPVNAYREQPVTFTIQNN
ncbi:MAG TPA: energy transducer TonB [Chitinophagaceae bacterium]|nr:energy transducer TonB [Chitinophagaceae bacterium]